MTLDLDTLDKLNAERTGGRWVSGGTSQVFAYELTEGLPPIVASLTAESRDADLEHWGEMDAMQQHADAAFIAAIANAAPELIRLARIAQALPHSAPASGDVSLKETE